MELAARRTTFVPLMLRTLLGLAILGIGWGGYAMLSQEPEQSKKPRGKPRVIRTRVVELAVEDFQTTVSTRGIVRAHNEVTLTGQVSGRIVKVMPNFEDGAFFEKDEVLLELDPADFEVAVIAANAQLARATAAFKQEETRANQARRNWEELGYTEEPNDLVLRKPQLAEAQANVDAANAQLARAKRDQLRAKIRAPFAGRVRRRSVGLGQAMSGGTPLGQIFAVDYAEVRLPIPGRDMKFLDLPETSEDSPVDVELRDALNPENSVVWKGQIVRTEGALDQSSLELFAIARIPDPFGRHRNSGGESKESFAPLRIGQPVLGSITGSILEDVVVVPRLAVRQLDRIYLVDKDELTLKRLTISSIWSDEDRMVVRDPEIFHGALLSVTNVVYAPDGSKVELMPEPESTEAVASEATAKADAAGTEKTSAKTKS